MNWKVYSLQHVSRTFRDTVENLRNQFPLILQETKPTQVAVVNMVVFALILVCSKLNGSVFAWLYLAYFS